MSNERDELARDVFLAQLVAVVERVEGLHVPVIEYGEPVGCKTCDWEVSGTWPCETIRAITGEGQ